MNDAETGFRLLYADEYAIERQKASGLYYYQNAYLQGLDIDANDRVCSSTEQKLTLDGYSGGANSTSNNLAGDMTTKGDLTLDDGAKACFVAANTFETGVFSATLLTSETGIGSFLVLVGGSAVYLAWEQYCSLH